MIIFKSHSTHSPTREKVTTSIHCNLTDNLCDKRDPTGNRTQDHWLTVAMLYLNATTKL